MRGVVYAKRDGKAVLPAIMLTGDYKSHKTLVSYGLRHLAAGVYEVEVYRNRYDIYGPPRYIFNLTVEQKQ